MKRAGMDDMTLPEYRGLIHSLLQFLYNSVHGKRR